MINHAHHAELAKRLASMETGPAAVPVVVGASPFTFTAERSGILVVVSGTVSLLQYGRSGGLTTLGILSGVIPMKAGDQVKATYLVAPTMTFI